MSNRLRSICRWGFVGIVGTLFLAGGLALGVTLACALLAASRAAQLHFFIR